MVDTNGLKTNTVEETSLADEVLVNRNGSTGRQLIEALALQLANTSPLSNMGNGGTFYKTVASLPSATGLGVGTSAIVFNDADGDNNGYWSVQLNLSAVKEWQFAYALQFPIVPAIDAGDGTANAIQATTRFPVSELALIVLKLFRDNAAGDVTLAINGNAPGALRDAAGNHITSAGALKGGLTVLIRKNGDYYDLMSDAASAASATAAQAFANAANTSAVASAGSADEASGHADAAATSADNAATHEAGALLAKSDTQNLRNEASAFAASAEAATYGTGADMTNLPNPSLVGAPLVFVDQSDHYLGHVGTDGTWTLPGLSLQGGVKEKGVRVTPSVEDTIADDLLVIPDAAGNAVFRLAKDGTLYVPAINNPEITAARGSRVSLDARLSQHLSAYGKPRQSFGKETLRQTKWRLMMRRFLNSTQLCVASLGDSYNQNAARWCGPAAAHLMSLYGDAGGGWVGFGSSAGTSDNGNVRPSLYGYSRTGTWDYSTYYGLVSPDLGEITSSTVGSRVSLSGPSAPALSVANLFWKATADGIMQYRWNGGSWTTRGVQGTIGSLYTAALATNMPTSGAWTLDVEVVSGTCSPLGIDLQSAADGVRWHKLGSTGSKAQQWASVSATQWKAGLTALAPNLIEIMFGPNDQGAARLPAQFASDLGTIIDNCRSACPTADILVMMPPENQRTTNTYSMAQYAAAAVEVVAARDAAWFDTQLLFGVNSADYADTSAFPLFASDKLHPNTATNGGLPIVTAFNEMIGVYQ